MTEDRNFKWSFEPLCICLYLETDILCVPRRVCYPLGHSGSLLHVTELMSPQVLQGTSNCMFDLLNFDQQTMKSVYLTSCSCCILNSPKQMAKISTSDILQNNTVQVDHSNTTVLFSNI